MRLTPSPGHTSSGGLNRAYRRRARRSDDTPRPVPQDDRHLPRSDSQSAPFDRPRRVQRARAPGLRRPTAAQRWSRALLRSALQAYWSASERADGPSTAIVVPSKPRMRCRALEDHDAAVLAAVARKRDDLKGLAVLIGLYTALRRSEISTLRWSDVDPTGWLTIVGKGDVTRTFPLHPALASSLGAARARRRPSGAVTTGFSGAAGTARSTPRPSGYGCARSRPTPA